MNGKPLLRFDCSHSSWWNNHAGSLQGFKMTSCSWEGWDIQCVCSFSWNSRKIGGKYEKQACVLSAGWAVAPRGDATVVRAVVASRSRPNGASCFRLPLVADQPLPPRPSGPSRCRSTNTLCLRRTTFFRAHCPSPTGGAPCLAIPPGHLPGAPPCRSSPPPSLLPSMVHPPWRRSTLAAWRWISPSPPTSASSRLWRPSSKPSARAATRCSSPPPARARRCAS